METKNEEINYIDPFGNGQVILEGQRFVCPSCTSMFYVPPKISHLIKSCPFCEIKFDRLG